MEPQDEMNEMNDELRRSRCLDLACQYLNRTQTSPTPDEAVACAEVFYTYLTQQPKEA